jgi:CBS domain containing-hemolysin-like protein
MVDIYIALPLLGGLVALSAFFSGLEVALISIGKGQLRRIVNEGKQGSKSLEKLKSSPSRMLVTLLLGNNLVNVAAAAVATDVATNFFGNVGLGIATGVMTMILLVFGEITPKAYCNIHAEPIALRYSRVILGMQFALYPIVRGLERVTNGIFQVMGSEEKPKPISEEEVRAIIDVGVEEKALAKSEQEMMEDVMEFHDTKVRAIMTPRNKILVLDARMLLWDALPLINESGYSRIPIMEETKDNIVGIVHIRDVLKAVETNTSYMMLKDVARKPLFVSMEMGINKLMKEFQGRRIHMAIVVDEHGSTEGIVTLEDIIEELVGEIADETDVEAQQIKKLDKQTVITRGDVEIDDVNEALNIRLPKDKDYSTLSGLLHDKLRRIPRKGDTIEIGNVLITVEETGKSQPLSVRIKKTTHDVVETQQKKPES